MTSPTSPVGAGPPPPDPAPPSGREEHRSVDHQPRPVGWAVVLIAVGVLWLLAVADVPIRWELVLPAAIIVIGLLVLVTGRRAGGDGLIGFGIVLVVITLVVPLGPGPLSLSAGERTHRISDAAELEPDYALGAGSLTLDLRELELTDEATEITARVIFGELVVQVPAGATITGDASVAIGEAASFGRSRGGIVPAVTLEEAGPGAGAPVLDLDLQVGFGRIEVTR